MAAHRKFTLLPVAQGLDIVTDCRNGSITLCTRSLGDLTRLTQRQAHYTVEWLQGQYCIIHGSLCKLQYGADK